MQKILLFILCCLFSAVNSKIFKVSIIKTPSGKIIYALGTTHARPKTDSALSDARAEIEYFLELLQKAEAEDHPSFHVLIETPDNRLNSSEDNPEILLDLSRRAKQLNLKKATLENVDFRKLDALATSIFIIGRGSGDEKKKDLAEYLRFIQRHGGSR